jgi:AAHS family 4-hydroxybenzoate transporter-like MFS transporter
LQQKIIVQDVIDARGVTPFSIIVAVLCAVVLFADGFNTQIIGFIAPAITKEWAIDKAALGLVFSAGFAGLLVGLLLFSSLPNKIGTKRVVLLCTAMFAICTMLTLLSDTVAELKVFRFITGIGLGGAIPGAISLTGEYAPRKRRGTILLLMNTGFAFGAVAGGSLASVMLVRYGWRPILFIGGLVPFCALFALMRYLPESVSYLLRQPGGGPKVQAILHRIDPARAIAANADIAFNNGSARKLAALDIFRDGRLLGTLLVGGVFLVTLMETFCLQSWLPTMLVDQGFSVPAASAIGTLFSASGIAAVLVVGPFIDRYGPYRVMGALFLLGTGFVAGLGLVLGKDVTLLYPVVVLAGFCVGSTQKAGASLLVYYYPTDLCAAGAGWSYGVGRLGAIAGPVVIGFALHSGLPPATVFYFGAVPMLFGAACVLALGALAGRRGAGSATRLAGGAASTTS